MSLINEALKKTQTATSRPGVSAFPADGESGRGPKLKARHIIQLVIGLSILSGLITGIGGLLVYLFVFRQADVGTPLERAQEALTIMQEVLETPPAPAVAPEAAPELQTASPAAPAVEPVAEPQGDPQGTEAPTAAAAVVAEEPEQVVEVAPEPAQTAQATVADYVRALEVRGVMRGSGKVLLYLPDESRSSSFSSSETVNFALGLTLLRITDNTLIFADDAGHEYIKRF